MNSHFVQGLTICLIFSLLGCQNIAHRQSEVQPGFEANTDKVAFSERVSPFLISAIRKKADRDLEKISESLLFKLVYSNRLKELQPDSLFSKTHEIFSDQNVEIQDAYVKHLYGYLTEADYHCSNPAYASYFDSRFETEGLAPSCGKPIPFLTPSINNAKKIIWLTPDRISGIHVLFAGKGKGIVSSYGHISLRLIVCPQDSRKHEDCENNLTEHIVLGYRAHVDDHKISMLKGLAGYYNVHLFSSDFMSVYSEYAIGEFREVYSLPLFIDQEKMGKIVRLLSNIHWNYSGNYKFLTNNCSSLMQRALTFIWLEGALEERLTTTYIRPDSFFEALRSSPAADSRKLRNLDKAEEDGYYFSSTKKYYEQAMAHVRSQLSNPYFSNLDEYLSKPPIERAAWMQRDNAFLSKLKQDPHLAEAQIMLEELSVIRSERRLMAEFSNYFDKNNVSDINKHMSANLGKVQYHYFLNCILDPVLAMTNPIRSSVGAPVFRRNIENENTSENGACELSSNSSNVSKVRSELEVIDFKSWQPVKQVLYYWAESIRNVIYYTQFDRV